MSNFFQVPGKGDYRIWNVNPINSSSDNYFGFKLSVNAGGKYYAPFYADFAYAPKSAVKTWYVSKVDTKNGVAVVKQLEGTVAKSQAVFVECPSATASGNRVDLTFEEGNAATGNLMQGVYFSNGSRSNQSHKDKNPAAVEFDPATMRVLGVDNDGKLAFVSSSSNLVSTKLYKGDNWVDALCIPHNQSYLTVDSDCPATLKVMTEEEYEATGIGSIEAEAANDSRIYDMSGRVVQVSGVEKLQKGVYIVGKKKIAVK